MVNLDDIADPDWSALAQSLAVTATVIRPPVTVEMPQVVKARGVVDFDLILRRQESAKEPPKKSRGGGRPPTVRDAVEAWWSTLPEQARQRSCDDLAREYLSRRGHPGSDDRVSKIIAELKRK